MHIMRLGFLHARPQGKLRKNRRRKGRQELLEGAAQGKMIGTNVPRTVESMP